MKFDINLANIQNSNKKSLNIKYQCRAGTFSHLAIKQPRLIAQIWHILGTVGT